MSPNHCSWMVNGIGRSFNLETVLLSDGRVDKLKQIVTISFYKRYKFNVIANRFLLINCVIIHKNVCTNVKKILSTISVLDLISILQ